MMVQRLVSHAFSHLFMKVILITLAHVIRAVEIGALQRLILMEFEATISGDTVRRIAEVISNIVM